MVSSDINIRTCFPDELYKLYSVRAKISPPQILGKNTPSRAYEISAGKKSVVMIPDFTGCKRCNTKSGPCRTAK
jgi:hypothetical protein